MANRIRSLLLPLAVTLACLSGAVYLGVPSADAAPIYPEARLCSNTECEGVKYCRYNYRIDCVFGDLNMCTNYQCSTGD